MQSRVASTLTVPVAPDAGADDMELLTLTWHFDDVGAVMLTDDDPQPADAIAKTAIDAVAS